MKRIYKWYINLSKRMRDSIQITIAIVGLVATIFTIFGISLKDFKVMNILARIGVVFVFSIIICIVVYLVIGSIFKNSINMRIKQTPVLICCGDIFDTKGWKVIGCDTHFDTRVDDVVIAKKSLHGQLVLEHGNKEEIVSLIETAAKRLNIPEGKDGLYDFPLGTIIRYDSSTDDQTYLMLAMTKLDENFEAHTSMAEYEQTLMKMWKEIDRVYAMNDIVVPLLGAGIPRFDSGPIGRDALLKCMLCTLNSSGVSLKANLRVVIYGDNKDIPLYEYKDMFHEILRR